MFNIVKNKKIFYIISAIVILAGIVSMFIQGFKMDIDFAGGIECTVSVGAAVDSAKSSEIASIVKDATGVNATVQKAGDNGTHAIIKISDELTTEKELAMKAALKEKLGIGDEAITNFEVVSPTVGKEMQTSAILAVVIAVALMLVYISVRFEFLSGCAAVCSLVHDVLVMVSFYSIFQIAVNTTFIAAILTILGYSINATIVLFDRVRENQKLTRKETFSNIVNTSVWQTMMRSLNTSITTLATIIVLFFVGVSSIKEFALPITIGVVAGFYSSVFLSGNLWIFFKKLAKHKNI
ncbi:MAG: protein translocase subunit SecF [Clostridia bacterium]|nr:protein translocase subunit SecF [Clostridia bacterium]